MKKRDYLASLIPKTGGKHACTSKKKPVEYMLGDEMYMEFKCDGCGRLVRTPISEVEIPEEEVTSEEKSLPEKSSDVPHA